MPGKPYGVVLGDATPPSGVQDSPLMGSMMKSRSGSTTASTIGSASGKSDMDTNMMNSWGNNPNAVHVMRLTKYPAARAGRRGGYQAYAPFQSSVYSMLPSL